VIKMVKSRKKIQIINGPNLNMLGKREPHLYGSLSLEDINGKLVKTAGPLGIELSFFQSNHEGMIIDKIHDVFDENIDGVIINPAALTHTSIALRDALLLLSCPIVEIHLSNIYKREDFRHRSMIADIAAGQVSGFGYYGYIMALNAMAEMVKS